MNVSDAFYRADIDGEQAATGAVLREALAIAALSSASFDAYVWALAEAAAESERESTRTTYRDQWCRAFLYSARRAQERVVEQEQRAKEMEQKKAEGHWAKRERKIGWQ